MPCTAGCCERSAPGRAARSISEVCEQQIVNSFRYAIIADLLEAKKKDLTAELHDSRIAFKVANERREIAERRVAELTEQNQQLSRAAEASETRIYGLIEKLNDGFQRVHGLSVQIDNLTAAVTKLATEKK